MLSGKYTLILLLKKFERSKALETFILNGITFVAGTFTGLLNNVLTSKAKKWEYVLYILGASLLLVAGYSLLIDIKMNKYLSISAIIISIFYILFTYILLNYSSGSVRTKKLIPQVIEFTENARKDEIRLWGGDLSFFGNKVSDMDKNNQYIQLKSKSFDKILILCKKPNNIEIKKCYGKILLDFESSVEFKFYNDKSQDLHIRGRIKMKFTPDIFVALVYEKIDNDNYIIIEEDLSKYSNGSQIYIKLWEMSWANAEKLSTVEKNDFKDSLKEQ